MREPLAKTQALTDRSRISGVRPLPTTKAWERLEEALIRSGGFYVGIAARRRARAAYPDSRPVRVIGRSCETRSSRRSSRCSGGSVRRSRLQAKPSVILVVGVNGTGRRRRSASCAQAVRARARRAVRRSGHVPRGRRGAARDLGRAGRRGLRRWRLARDPAAVAFDAVEAARARGRDVVIIDTRAASTQSNLMAEPREGAARDRRAHRRSAARDAPRRRCDDGQNGLQQAKLFGETAGVREWRPRSSTGSARRASRSRSRSSSACR